MAGTVRKVVVSGLLVVAAAGLGSAGWLWWTDWRFIQSTDDAYVHGDISVISAKISGYVRDIPAGDNQPVKAGDVLVVIDDADYRARADQAAAAVEAQRAALLSNDARAALERAMIAQAEANIASAEAERRRAGLELARVRALNTDAWATRQRLETAEADQAKAVAAVARARAALDAERDQIAVL